jgi:hypothetical protein
VRYDADREPKAETWLQLDESERLDAVLSSHKGMGLKGDRAKLHAVAHTVIENQLAEGHPDARGALDRLMAEGLTRHEAVHAIGIPFSEQMLNTLKNNRPFDPEEYKRALGKLTAASWRTLAEDE